MVVTVEANAALRRKQMIEYDDWDSLPKPGVAKLSTKDAKTATEIGNSDGPQFLASAISKRLSRIEDLLNRIIVRLDEIG